MKTFFSITSKDESDFDLLASECKEVSKILSKDKKILIISHLDADGLSSCAITRTALDRANINYDWIVVQGIDEQIYSMSKKYDLLIFTDLGSSQLSLISKIKEKEIIILDHHEPDITDEIESIYHINPHRIGVTDSRSLSGAGMTYIFAYGLDKKNIDLAHIAIIGAIGDVQENKGFVGLNALIFQHAFDSQKISAKKGLKLFGAQSKPLVKLIAYNNDLGLKGINGNLRKAKEFIEELGIQTYKNGKETRFIDLNENDKLSLQNAIRDYREGITGIPDIEGYNYTLNEESGGSMFKDAREYATFLNACGRMDRSDVGIGSLMNDNKSKRLASDVLKEYKYEIGQALNWLKEQFYSKEHVISERGFIIIDARNSIRASIIGTIASIASRMSEIDEGTIILSIATLDTGDFKASLRKKGNDSENLHDLMGIIAKKSDSYSGGHENASGATIPKDKYDKFIETTISVLKEKSF